MSDYIKDKSIIITGAASGFGMLTSQKAAEMGAKVTCADVNAEALEKVVSELTNQGFEAQAVPTDVSDSTQMYAMAEAAIEKFGAIDVMVNNAGIMPLAFFSDHKEALSRWHQCIDINLKGVVNGIAAVSDQMARQGRGHVINVSSIFGNAPVLGGGVYAATKTAVNFLSENLRLESQGKIKVTTIRPTGVPATNLNGTVINQAAGMGILGHNGPVMAQEMAEQGEAYLANFDADQESIGCQSLDPAYVADAIVHAINQPWGVSISDITVRATGEAMIL